MMYKLIILQSANQDIHDAAKWYEKRSNGLGKRFTSDVRKKVRLIERNPLSSTIRYDEVRTAVLSVFPFMIHYYIDEKDKTIVISAVFHTSRDPGIWKKR